MHESRGIAQQLITALQRRLSARSFWNTKYPERTIRYHGRHLKGYGVLSVDVRSFFVNPVVEGLQDIVGELSGCDDQKAYDCLTYVLDHIRYVSDKSQFGLNEFWMLPQETLHTRKGDCDDQAILLANLLRASGIPDWKIRVTAGTVSSGEGHLYVTYYVESRKRWVALDCTFYPNRKSVNERPDYKQSKIYLDVWFSFNAVHAWSFFMDTTFLFGGGTCTCGKK